MAEFYIDLDTKPLQRELQDVSDHVDRTSGAVVSMQAAVVQAEEVAAKHVCAEVNRGFFSMMYSKITQDIAKLSSTVEAKLMELTQSAHALSDIKNTMTGDYNMISRRYTKLFRTLNSNLEGRVAELDAPVFQLVNRDYRLSENRIRLNAALYATGQLESILSSQMIATSKMKRDADHAIKSIAKYVDTSAKESRKSDASLHSVKIEALQEICLPFCVMESSGTGGGATVDYYVAESGEPIVDDKLKGVVRGFSVDVALNGSWEGCDPQVKSKVEMEFSKLVAQSDMDERVKSEVSRLFEASGEYQQFKIESHEQEL